MRKTWDKCRLVPRPTAVRQTCKECGGDFWLPPSKVGPRLTCSTACANASLGRAKAARSRPCETCGKDFSPRTGQLAQGQGRFCSQACNVAARTAVNSPEAQVKAVANRAASFAAGNFHLPSGPDHSRWKGGGGPKAWTARRTATGAAAATLRAYRKANPDKVREFTQRREGRKLGRLASGTIPRLLVAQKRKCAICRKSIRRGYHVDHIVPLARGGQHAASNVQLLCAPCNLAKHSRDPIEHMQSLGRLL